MKNNREPRALPSHQVHAQSIALAGEIPRGSHVISASVQAMPSFPVGRAQSAAKRHGGTPERLVFIHDDRIRVFLSDRVTRPNSETQTDSIVFHGSGRKIFLPINRGFDTRFRLRLDPIQTTTTIVPSRCQINVSFTITPFIGLVRALSSRD